VPPLRGFPKPGFNLKNKKKIITRNQRFFSVIICGKNNLEIREVSSEESLLRRIAKHY
jgi:hypothetical protein